MCPFCLAAITPDTANYAAACTHVFHTGCWKTWLQEHPEGWTCPRHVARGRASDKCLHCLGEVRCPLCRVTVSSLVERGEGMWITADTRFDQSSGFLPARIAHRVFRGHFGRSADDVLGVTPSQAEAAGWPQPPRRRRVDLRLGDVRGQRSSSLPPRPPPQGAGPAAVPRSRGLRKLPTSEGAAALGVQTPTRGPGPKDPTLSSSSSGDARRLGAPRAPRRRRKTGWRRARLGRC